MKRILYFIVASLLIILINGCLNSLKTTDEPPIYWYRCLKSMNIDGSNVKELVWEYEENFPNNDHSYEVLQFSYDGSVVTDKRIIMNIDGSNRRKILPSGKKIDNQCTLKDSHNMFISKYFSLLKLDLLTETYTTLIDSLPFRQIEPFHNSNKLLLMGHKKMYIFDMDSSTVVDTIKMDTNIVSPVVSADDTEIFFGLTMIPGHDYYEVKAYNLETGETRIAAPRGNLMYGDYASQRFVYENNGRCELLILDGDRYQYVDLGEMSSGYPQISADGNTIAFTRGLSTCVYNGNGNLIYNYKSRVIHFSLSSTGNKILYYGKYSLNTPHE